MDNDNLDNYIIQTDFYCSGRAQKHSVFGWNDYKTDNSLTLTDVQIAVPYQGLTGLTYKFYTDKLIQTTNSKDVALYENLQDYSFPIADFSWVVVPSIVHADVTYTNQGCVSIHYTCD